MDRKEVGCCVCLLWKWIINYGCWSYMWVYRSCWDVRLWCIGAGLKTSRLKTTDVFVVLDLNDCSVGYRQRVMWCGRSKGWKKITWIVLPLFCPEFQLNVWQITVLIVILSGHKLLKPSLHFFLHSGAVAIFISSGVRGDLTELQYKNNVISGYCRSCTLELKIVSLCWQI